MDLMELAQKLTPLLGIFLSIPFIQVIVRYAREAGLQDRYAPLAAVFLGGLFGALTGWVATFFIDYSPYVLYIYCIFIGLQAGASAAGFYKATKYDGTTTAGGLPGSTEGTDTGSVI